MTRTQTKRGIAMTYGDIETSLASRDAVKFLEDRLRLVPANIDGQGVDNSLLSYADKYDIASFLRSQSDFDVDETISIDTNMKAHLLAESAVDRIQGVDGRFEAITAEAILRMNKEYFGYLMDASYSQDTQAPDVVSQGIEACEGLHGNTFTTTELFESGEYIVNDYSALIEHGLSARMPGSMANGIENSQPIEIKTLPNLETSVVQKLADEQVTEITENIEQKPEQLQLDFGEAVEQLSMDLDDGLEQ